MGDPGFYWYEGDYLRDTSHLLPLEDLAYRRLLGAYYARGGPLPAPIDRLCLIARLPEEVVRPVADEFLPVKADGLRHNKKADQIIAERKAFLEEQSRKGKLSAAARRGRKDPGDGEGGGNPGTNRGSTPVQPRFEPGSNRRGNRKATSSSSSSSSSFSSSSSTTLAAAPLPPKPPAAAAGSPPAQGGAGEDPPPSLEPEVFRGDVLVVDRVLHARLKRIAPESFLREQYPIVDAKLATQLLENEEVTPQRAATYAVSAIAGRWGDVKGRGEEARYRDPKPYRPPEAPEPVELTKEERAEGAAAMARIVDGLTRGRRVRRDDGPVPIGDVLGASQEEGR